MGKLYAEKLLRRAGIFYNSCPDDSRFDLSFEKNGKKYYIKSIKAGKKCAVTVESKTSLLMRRDSGVFSTKRNTLTYDCRENIAMYTTGRKNVILLFGSVSSLAVDCDDFSDVLTDEKTLFAMTDDSLLRCLNG